MSPLRLSETEVLLGVHRTKNALYLLTLGLLLAWVPFFNLVGIVFALPGAVLVFLGRRAFGRRHASLVLIAMAIYTAGWALSTVVTLGLLDPQVGAAGAVDFAAVRGQVRGFLWADLASTMLLVVATALFILDLPTPSGRVLLGLAAGLAILGATLSTLGILALVDGIFSGTGSPSEMGLRMGRLLGSTPFLYAVPGALAFAAAYFLPTVLIAKERLPRGAATA